MTESLQNFTVYQPTAKEQAILDTLIDPENRMKSVTQICKLAKCTRPVYYAAFRKPEFVELYKEQSMDLLKQSIGPVINTFIRETQRGSFPHGKVILEMLGLYTERADINVSGEVGVDIINDIPRQPSCEENGAID